MRLHLFSAGTEKDKPGCDAGTGETYHYNVKRLCRDDLESVEENRERVREEENCVKRGMYNHVAAQFHWVAAQEQEDQYQEEGQAEVDAARGREFVAHIPRFIGRVDREVRDQA